MQKENPSLLRSVVHCFHPSFYPKILRQNGWRSFLYLGLLCLLVYGFLSYRMASAVFDADERGASDFYEKALPDFHFHNGEASYPPQEPHIYEEKVKDKTLAIIVDTSGDRDSIDEKYDGGLLITKTEIVARDFRGIERRDGIPATADKVTAKDFFIGQIRQRRSRDVLSMTFHAYLLHLAVKVGLVLLVAGGLILSDRGKHQTYPFGYYFNIGCYAVTPFVLSALVRGTVNSPIAIWTSYGVSLLLVLSLAASGLAKCKQQDARELQSEKQPAIWETGHG